MTCINLLQLSTTLFIPILNAIENASPSSIMFLTLVSKAIFETWYDGDNFVCEKLTTNVYIFIVISTANDVTSRKNNFTAKSTVIALSINRVSTHLFCRYNDHLGARIDTFDTVLIDTTEPAWSQLLASTK
jgi:hypothetical protein